MKICDAKGMETLQKLVEEKKMCVCGKLKRGNLYEKTQHDANGLCIGCSGYA